MSYLMTCVIHIDIQGRTTKIVPEANINFQVAMVMFQSSFTLFRKIVIKLLRIYGDLTAVFL